MDFRVIWLPIYSDKIIQFVCSQSVGIGFSTNQDSLKMSGFGHQFGHQFSFMIFSSMIFNWNWLWFQPSTWFNCSIDWKNFIFLPGEHSGWWPKASQTSCQQANKWAKASVSIPNGIALNVIQFHWHGFFSIINRQFQIPSWDFHDHCYPIAMDSNSIHSFVIISIKLSGFSIGCCSAAEIQKLQHFLLARSIGHSH